VDESIKEQLRSSMFVPGKKERKRWYRKTRKGGFKNGKGIHGQIANSVSK